MFNEYFTYDQLTVLCVDVWAEGVRECPPALMEVTMAAGDNWMNEISQTEVV